MSFSRGAPHPALRRATRRLARDVLVDPVRITVGILGQAAQNITQKVEVLDATEQKCPAAPARCATNGKRSGVADTFAAECIISACSWTRGRFAGTVLAPRLRKMHSQLRTLR